MSHWGLTHVCPNTNLEKKTQERSEQEAVRQFFPPVEPCPIVLRISKVSATEKPWWGCGGEGTVTASQH